MKNVLAPNEVGIPVIRHVEEFFVCYPPFLKDHVSVCSVNDHCVVDCGTIPAEDRDHSARESDFTTWRWTHLPRIF
jgi:hypothetical protein